MVVNDKCQKAKNVLCVVVFYGWKTGSFPSLQQAQKNTFLDDFSKQLEKIVTFRLLQGASSIYYP